MGKTAIGEFIAALRKAQGLTQQQVADRLGVSNKTVSSWETGASCPDIAMLPAIAELYGVTCDEILRGEHISADETAQVKEAEREKAIDFRLARRKNDLFLCTMGGYALAILGAILTFAISLGAARPRLGFGIGAVPMIAAAFAICMICHNALFWCSQEELGAEALQDFRRAIFRARGRVCITNATAFGLIFLHLIYWGGSLSDLFFHSIFTGSIIGASVFLLSLTIYLFLKAYSPLFPQAMRRTLRFRLWTALCTIGVALVGWAVLFFVCISAQKNFPVFGLPIETFLIAIPLIVLAAMCAVYAGLQIGYHFYRNKHE